MKYVLAALYILCFFIAALCLSAAATGLKKGMLSSVAILIVLSALFGGLAVLFYRKFKKKKME